MDKRKVSLEDILDKRRITPIFRAIVSLKDGEILGYESLSRIVGESYFDSIVGLFDTADVCQRFKELESLCLSKSIEVGHSFFSASSSNGKLFLNVNPNMINDASFKAAFSPRALEKMGLRRVQLHLKSPNDMSSWTMSVIWKILLILKRWELVSRWTMSVPGIQV